MELNQLISCILWHGCIKWRWLTRLILTILHPGVPNSFQPFIKCLEDMYVMSMISVYNLIRRMVICLWKKIACAILLRGLFCKFFVCPNYSGRLIWNSLQNMKTFSGRQVEFTLKGVFMLFNYQEISFYTTRFFLASQVSSSQLQFVGLHVLVTRHYSFWMVQCILNYFLSNY